LSDHEEFLKARHLSNLAFLNLKTSVDKEFIIK